MSNIWTREDLEQMVSSDAAVLVQYLAKHEDCDIVFQMLWCHEDTQITASKLPSMSLPILELQLGAVHMQVNQVTLGVADLRNALQEAPVPGKPCSERAEQALQEMSQWLLAPLAATLNTWRQAGKRRLIVVPHGPLHFLPMHLLQIDGTPLMQDWLVTTAPNLACLRKYTSHRQADVTCTAVGLGFKGNTWGLDELPEALLEAQVVARASGGHTLLDDNHTATKSAILAALQTSRWVHIASHGLHNPIAPMFQCLYVPLESDGSGGEIYTHELAKLDLSHLELVTLSACETALGRVDEADNLLGLPAALFIAGASTVVGTLWTVESNAARAFFEVFYRELNRGAEPPEAFACAQRAVRKEFPEYRDWGAFHYSGCGG